jgi:cytochrome c oxidase subunit 3
MATESNVASHAHSGNESAELWMGGKSPFKTSYGKLMMWYFLLSDAFTFAGFLIAYGALRFSMPTWPVPDFVFKTAPFAGHTNLPLIFVTFMTFVLIVSSVTMVRAVQEGHRENKDGVVKWMLFTIIGGATFLSCQAWEWNNLMNGEGMSIYTNPFSAHLNEGTYMSGAELEAAGFKKVSEEVHGATDTYYLGADGKRYYEKVDHQGHSHVGKTFKKKDPYLITYSHDTHVLQHAAFKTSSGEVMREEVGPRAFGALFFFITGFHGFHVLSGVVFLIIITINVAGGVYIARGNGYEMVEKMGLYWHFVDLVWVFVFLAFYLL